MRTVKPRTCSLPHLWAGKTVLGTVLCDRPDIKVHNIASEFMKFADPSTVVLKSCSLN